MAPLPSVPPAAVDFTSKTLPPAPAQTHSTLGTELWENKVAGGTVLPDVKKREWEKFILVFNLCLLLKVVVIQV